MNRLSSIVLIGFLSASASMAAEFRSAWPKQIERVWAGPEYWANPLQDWRIANGRLECVDSGRNRNVSLLTHQVSDKAGDLRMSVRLGRMENYSGDKTAGWAGFRIGVKGQLNDYRDSALRGRGMDAGITTAGQLFIGKPGNGAGTTVPLDSVELQFTAQPSGSGYDVVLQALDPKNGNVIASVKQGSITSRQLAGNVAVVSSTGTPGDPAGQNIYQAPRGGDVRFWFADWEISGSKVEGHENQTFGPILFAQHTLSKGIMKMTAQMPPIGVGDSPIVNLQIKDAGGSQWKTIDYSYIHTLARTATFRIEKWESTRDVPYRLVYSLSTADGKTKDHYWEGTIRREPLHRDTLVVAGFTGNQDTGFPNTNTVRNVGRHNPDVLVFTGDQIYENVAGYGIQREPVETSALDYLRKWYLVGWSFGDLMRDRVTVTMPDDHDVYQGNIWGAGGRKTTMEEHDAGGYAMPAEWVRMVERTQASHLPDPYDPRPIEQGIGVYYTEMNYARISFGIIEDRKFKTGPKGTAPPTGGRPDHVTDPNFDRKSFDIPEAHILGKRQLDFIKDWASDWRNSDMKVSLMQTIFANAATTHGGNMMRLAADLDSNGWPQSARNRALDALRRGYVFMLGGDQHLPSIIQHGIDDWDDAGYSFCVPSISAGYPRAFWPETPGKDRKPGAPEFTGKYLDGLHNKITVHAMGNPEKKQRNGVLEKLHDKASGYGILRLNRKTGKITIECWKLLVDVSNPSKDSQFPGWPMTIDMQDNYGRKAVAWLPSIEVSGLTNPVVQVVDEAGGEIVYTLRIRGNSFRPKVFKNGTYTVRVGEPDKDTFQTFRNVQSQAAAGGKTLQVKF